MSSATWRSAVEFVLFNFSTPIAFYLTFRAWGPKAAIAFAIGTTFLQILAHKFRRQDFSPFFLVSSGFTVLFGTADLLIASPRFFRFEPTVHNFVVGWIFMISSFTRRPLIAWFAEALPEWAKPTVSELSLRYLSGLTRVWGAYFLLKAAFYLYLAMNVDLGTLIVLRSIIGGGSLMIIVLAEVAYRKWQRKL